MDIQCRRYGRLKRFGRRFRVPFRQEDRPEDGRASAQCVSVGLKYGPDVDGNDGTHGWAGSVSEGGKVLEGAATHPKLHWLGGVK